MNVQLSRNLNTRTAAAIVHLDGMFERITEHGQEKWRFPSRDGLIAYIHDNLKRHLDDISKENPAIPKPSFDEFLLKGKRTTDTTINNSWEEHDWRGSLFPESLEHDIRRDAEHIFRIYRIPHDSAAKEATRRAGRELAEHSGSARFSGGISSSAGSHAGAVKPPAAQRWFLVGVAGLGGIAAIHGAIAAATAVDQESRQRDWRKTALHTAEAVIGLAVSWGSIARLRGQVIFR